MMFEWKHTDKDNKTTDIERIVYLKNCVNRSSGLGGQLVCSSCEGNVEQTYICQNCGTAHLSNNGILKDMEFTTDLKKVVGKMDKRRDKLTGIIYGNNDKNAFMETKVDDYIKVTDEITVKDVMDNMYYTETLFEMFNNDDTKSQDLIKKIHNYLNEMGIAFLVQFAYRGSEMGGFIISAKDKLLLYSLRDYNLIKDTLQIGLKVRNSNITEKLKAITTSNEESIYKEFLQSIAENKPIKKKIVKQEKPKEVSISFLEGF